MDYSIISLKAYNEMKEQDIHIDEFVEDMGTVCEGGVIRVLTGEATPFNDKRVTDALRAAKAKPGALIRIITGPIVLLNKEGSNGLMDLPDRDTIIDELRHRPVRAHSEHFRVVQTGEREYQFHSKYSHRLLLAEQERTGLDTPDLPPAERLRLAEGAISFFDALLDRLKEISIPSVTLPLRMTEEGLRSLADIASKERIVFDYTSADKLVALPGAKALFRNRASSH